MIEITAYTDGSATTRYPYLGGIGVYIVAGDAEYKIRKGYSCTKTGRCELLAAITCMRSVKNKRAKLKIYSDSMYVVNTCNLWIFRWERTAFVGKKNVDLLKQLLSEIKKFDRKPELVHIKGHQVGRGNNIKGNNIADELANYKTQSSYEVDAPLEDPNNVEKEDFYEDGGKLYYRRENV